ncbi:hypothetical protein [Chitinophaga sp. LS1]|uniref:hypothetical protein n=1 Tax=Chitinophaga sp. LS1 TaxID=3051176 RepID=UPI002AAAE1DE|nr:hypothetical protein [Chitinophaga sp. LS1]WPV66543.1 hypothetical protein QQL36_32635 [Chitinophaga sp. LS1]
MHRMLTLCIALFFTFSLLAQSALQVKKDSVKVKKAELVIENSTKDSLGFLYNNGSGQTSFKKSAS